MFIEDLGVGGAINFYLVKKLYLRIDYEVGLRIEPELFFEALAET